MDGTSAGGVSVCVQKFSTTAKKQGEKDQLKATQGEFTLLKSSNALSDNTGVLYE